MDVFLLLICVGLANTVTADCAAGWFGPRCEYTCHCSQNAVCDSEGKCPNQCDSKWFGPACQYQDIASSNFMTTLPRKSTTYLTDNDDSSCVENITSISFNVIDSDQKTIITWLRVTLLTSESDCLDGTYGLGCERLCNCAVRKEPCFVSTGGCPSGCPEGFQGEGCKQTCDPGFYGTNCLQACSTTCSGQLCHHLTGYCEACSRGYYGETCGLKCSVSCGGDGTCRRNGSCIHGCVSGYQGENCLNVCDVMKYGPVCKETCSPNCKPVDLSGSTTCHHVTGACLLGCQNGYTNPTCSDGSTSYALYIGIGVGVVAALVIVAVIVGCVLYRRYKTTAGSEPRQRNSSTYVNDEYAYATVYVTPTSRKTTVN